MDPLAEKYLYESTYAYVGNNPLFFIDPDGKEKIIALDKERREDQTIISAAEQYKDDGAIHIFAHGNSQGISAVVDDVVISIKTPEDLENFLTAHSEIWQNKKERTQTTIIFHSCETGKNNSDGTASFAQKVSKSDIFSDAKIIAPNEKIWTSNIRGYVGVFKTDSQGGKSYVSGSWRIFEGGRQTKFFDGNWKPKEKPTLMDRIKY